MTKLFLLYTLLCTLFSVNVLGANTIKIGFVLSTLQEERYQKDQKYFIDHAKTLGFEAIVVSAENSPQTQAFCS